MDSKGQGKLQALRVRTAPGRQGWWLVFALLPALGLLLAFGGVVRVAVRQGVTMREAVAAHAAATWRCDVLPIRGARADCLLQLAAASPAGSGAVPPAEASLVAENR
jgi:hypothetical protein